MLRRLALSTALLVLAAACSSSDDGSDAGVYFQEAATITNSYESAAFEYFVEYREALEAATAETGEAIFVDANKLLFSGLATEFGPAVAALGGLAPPARLEAEHAAWLAAARDLDAVFQSADDQLTPLTEAPAVNAVVSGLPLAGLQAAYRSACDAVAALAGDESPAPIACRPPNEGT